MGKIKNLHSKQTLDRVNRELDLAALQEIEDCEQAAREKIEEEELWRNNPWD